MENPEEVLQSLDEFVKLKPKDIPKELEDYLSYVAKTGDPVYQWSLVKCLFREKLVNVITEFYEGCPTIELPPCPNVDSFNYEIMKNSLLERLESFVSAPFTVQRLCELLTSPKKQYSRADKFMRAVEKNILVVSTREPGNVRRSDSNQTELVNGVADVPTVELVETIETTSSEGMNLMNVAASSTRLGVETTAVASTTRETNVEAKCSHSADTVDTTQKIVPGWMNDPNLTDTSRPSVSERVAMIEKADTSTSLDVGNKLTAEFHSRFNPPISDPALGGEEDEEDIIQSSQEDNQYFPPQKLKAAPAEIMNVTDLAENLPSPDSSETSAAVSAISEESSNSLIEAESLENAAEASAISSDTSQDTPESIEATHIDEIPEEPTIKTVETPVGDANLDTSLKSASVSTESANLPLIADNILISEDCDASSSVVESPHIVETSEEPEEEERALVEETPEVPVEIPQDIADLLPSVETIQPFVTEPSEEPTTDADKSIPESNVEESEPSPPVEIGSLAEALDTVEESDEKISEPEQEVTKLTSEEERDREMMVQNERIESVIQGTPDQDAEQTFFREAPMESLPLEAVPVDIPLETLPLEVPMEDKPQEVEPEAMEVDETSQSDEPMDQGDLSPKQS